ncbi:ABC transporter ATP-binding protein [Candidatus Methylomirabilis lanthanidiphila]|uniref:ABC transporter ATP-binding protein n=1 Tax=Candidatus Methylomirabilis lanthanidiphila TaxID=2211376 RepID=A0A564ZH42_9BACT|nr:ATP-binding cassette domain-containing protein [Candidatus Methylomirabilis lanthanidiphila]VUZ84661.1 ABC transporter ATP-binding protein [Candidatus Methylomirabilis lanthanidiphila]
MNDLATIEFEHVDYQVPGGAVILDDVSFIVERGTVLVLVGRSGVGKTTILRLINRLLVPSAGIVRVEGRATPEWDPIALRRRTGYVLQEVGLFPHMTIGRNIAVVPRLEGWPEARIHARCRELLELVGLDPATFEGRFPHQLSGGQRQRVGFARALAADPPVILMDEPFGALDPLTRAELHREFRCIQEQLRKTVVMVSHDMGEAFALATRLGVLDQGRLVALDTPDTVARTRDPRVRMFLDAMPSVPVIARESA